MHSVWLRNWCCPRGGEKPFVKNKQAEQNCPLKLGATTSATSAACAGLRASGQATLWSGDAPSSTLRGPSPAHPAVSQLCTCRDCAVPHHEHTHKTICTLYLHSLHPCTHPAYKPLLLLPKNTRAPRPPLPATAPFPWRGQTPSPASASPLAPGSVAHLPQRWTVDKVLSLPSVGVNSALEMGVKKWWSEETFVRGSEWVEGKAWSEQKSTNNTLKLELWVLRVGKSTPKYKKKNTQITSRMQVFYANINLMYAREQSTENKEEAQNKDVSRSNALTAAQVAPVRVSREGRRPCTCILLDLGYWISKSKWIDDLTNQTWILAVVDKLHAPTNFNLVLSSKAFEGC